MTLAQSLAELLGPSGWLSAEDETARFSRDWLNQFGVHPLGVARPSTTVEVSAVMRLCHASRTPVVPQGGRTGLVGGSVTTQSDMVLISLSRMSQIEAINVDEFTAHVGAGVVLSQLHDALESEHLEFPLHLGSEGSAQIGGLIATNAGGSHAFRFGTMIDQVLGLEVVLANGDIWDGMRPLIKDNAGLQLRKLFCGSEGRLGIITRVILKLQPAPKNHVTALIALPSLETAMAVGRSLRMVAGEFLTALEFFDNDILGLALKNVPDLNWPMDGRSPYYLLTELASSTQNLDLSALLEQFLEPAIESEMVTDAVLAQSETQRALLWRIREDLPEGTLREGRQLKHDISIPVAQFPAFFANCAPKINAILPNTRIWTFGHLGDGNIHYNLSPPIGSDDFRGLDEDINQLIYQAAEEHGGSFAAEHGIGRSKRDMADFLRSSVERDLMARIHQALDPSDIMNPGVSI